MVLLDYWHIARKRWRLIASVTAVLTLAIGALSMNATPTYQATASVFFSLPFGNSAGELSQGALFTQNQMQSYAELATTPAVLQPVIDDLDLNTTPAVLDNRVVAQASSGSVIIRIRATDAVPSQAANIANAVAEQLQVEVEASRSAEHHRVAERRGHNCRRGGTP